MRDGRVDLCRGRPTLNSLSRSVRGKPGKSCAHESSSRTKACLPYRFCCCYIGNEETNDLFVLNERHWMSWGFISSSMAKKPRNLLHIVNSVTASRANWSGPSRRSRGNPIPARDSSPIRLPLSSVRHNTRSLQIKIAIAKTTHEVNGSGSSSVGLKAVMRICQVICPPWEMLRPVH